jgi:hypothetical protein
MSALEFQQIGFRESRRRVARHRDCRNHDKEKSERGRGKVGIDFFGFSEIERQGA